MGCSQIPTLQLLIFNRHTAPKLSVFVPIYTLDVCATVHFAENTLRREVVSEFSQVAARTVFARLSGASSVAKSRFWDAAFTDLGCRFPALT